ncbi:MAG: hypothetical protein ABSB32_11620 [Thermodesulfobacteriota bacterium]
MGAAFKLCISVMTLASLFLGGYSKPLLPYSVDTPPLTLATGAQ